MTGIGGQISTIALRSFPPRDRAISGGLFGSGLGLGTLTAALSFPIARSRP
ncbi:hypothetical protein H6F46_11625 [Limnothrix sp. FACHB-1083]|uniref:hypothetical protein n=1 Tax=unclassified Limnothrix TaxID=2632864 RepID=UPI0016808733|nr:MULTISPECIES: hypothetical protein [unclassified Limnothrix]MBD2161339.1 hypothetical protein [Limnothrix sp. FACHB-1083]MBD2192149.1 hypothetical protein [Limnothrix sp. FACHB-1088]